MTLCGFTSAVSAATGRVEGTVSFHLADGVTGSATVLVYARTGSGWTVTASQFVTSQPDGVARYGMSVASGDYRICVEPSWYLTDVARECYDDAVLVGASRDVTVSGGAITQVDLALDKAVRVGGQVVDNAGHSAGAFHVTAYAFDPDADVWAYVTTAYGDTDGRYQFQGLHGATYRVCAATEGRADLEVLCLPRGDTPADGEDIVVAPGEPRDDLDFTLPARASISGTVTRRDGADGSLAVSAQVWDSSISRWRSVSSAPTHGVDRYTIDGLLPGVHRVCVSGERVVLSCWAHSGPQVDDVAGAGDIPVGRGQQVTGIDLDARPGGSLTGIVSDVYLAAQGYLSIDLSRLIDGAWIAVDGQAIEGGPTVAYEWHNLPTGTYRVCVSHLDPEFVPGFAPECYGGTPNLASADDIMVIERETAAAINIDVDAAGSVRGKVTSEGAGIQTNVELYQGDRLVATGQSGADGRYGFGSLPAGTYRVGFHREGAQSPLAGEFYLNRTDGLGREGATAIVLPADSGLAFTTAHAALNPGATVAGRLEDAQGAGAGGCRVRADGPDGSLATRWTDTATDGSFNLGGLSTASYRLTIIGGTCPAYPDDVFLDRDEAKWLTTNPTGADTVPTILGQATKLQRTLGGPGATGADSDDNSASGDPSGNADTDTDGTPDTEDRCPLTPSGRYDGCPHHATRVALVRGLRPAHFRGRVDSIAATCERGRSVTMMQALPGADRRVRTVVTGPRARFSVAAPRRPGRYYAKVDAVLRPTTVCGPAVSGVVRARRH